jgi:hypothetical protein
MGDRDIECRKSFKSRAIITFAGGESITGLGTVPDEKKGTGAYSAEYAPVPFFFPFFFPAVEKTVLVDDAKTGRLEITDLLLDQTSRPMVTIYGDTIILLGRRRGCPALASRHSANREDRLAMSQTGE